MKILLIALGASTFAAPALAQHTGHPMPSPQPPTASDTEPVPSSPQAQPVPDQSQTVDPHAGRDMNAMPQPVPPPEPDPHAQHEMPGMQPAQPASPMIHGAGPDMIAGR